MSEIFNDKNMGVSPDRRKWLDAQQGASKNNTIKTARVADREREDALMWARKFIKREDLLCENDIERGYLTNLYCDIKKFGFDAKILGTSEHHLKAVLLAGQKISDPS